MGPDWEIMLLNVNGGDFAYKVWRAAHSAEYAVAPPGMELVPAVKLTFGDCWRFGLDIGAVRENVERKTQPTTDAAPGVGD